MVKRTYRGAVFFPGQWVNGYVGAPGVAEVTGPYRVISTRMGGAIVKVQVGDKQIERHASNFLWGSPPKEDKK